MKEGSSNTEHLMYEHDGRVRAALAAEIRAKRDELAYQLSMIVVPYTRMTPPQHWAHIGKAEHKRYRSQADTILDLLLGDAPAESVREAGEGT